MTSDGTGRAYAVRRIGATAVTNPGGSGPPAADRERRRLRDTLAVQREVNAAADRDDAMRIAADRVVDLFPAADGAAVELSDGRTLLYAATAGTLAGFAGLRLPRAGTLSGQALDTDTVIHRAEIHRAEIHRADTGGDRCRSLGIASTMIAPLHSGRAVIGVLEVCSQRTGVFDDADEQQLALLADSLSAALRHADDAAHAASLLAERSRALAELEVSENRFRLTFDNSPLGVSLCSLRPGTIGRHLQVNPAMTAITGYSAGELTTMTYADLQHPADADAATELTARLAAGDLDTAGAECRYRHKDGHTVWVSVRTAAVRDPDGTARYVVHQVEDVTARRAADAELRRHAHLLELIPAAVVVRALDGTVLWWNSGATRLYRWSVDAVRGRRIHQLLGTAFPGGLTADEHTALLLRDGRWEGRLDQSTADGRTVTVLGRHVLHQPDPDAGIGAEPQILEINTDVTAARAAELALAESEQRFRGQFANSAVGQAIQGLDGSLLAVNPAYAAMLGHTVDEITTRTDRDLLDPADLSAHRALAAGLFAGQADSYTHEGRVRHADGHRIDASTTISLVRDSLGRPKHFVAVLTDVSARRAAERALAERNADLEAANQLKLDIIGMLGHEIGNPLTAIRGHAEVLVDDWPRLTDERRGRAIDAIYRQAGRLDDIVQGVLAMVTIESGTIRADRQVLSVRTEIGRALAAVDEDVPVHGEDRRILFHPGHLQQILVNLLSNAGKYGGGATAIRIAGGATVDVTVEDEGPGVPEEFRDRLFDRLTRADRDARDVNGTGLGLYIVRGLAQANHGDIRHEPNPAGGSRFILRLPSGDESTGPDAA